VNGGNQRTGQGTPEKQKREIYNGAKKPVATTTFNLKEKNNCDLPAARGGHGQIQEMLPLDIFLCRLGLGHPFRLLLQTGPSNGGSSPRRHRHNPQNG